MADLVKTSDWKKANADERVALLTSMKAYASELAKVTLWLSANNKNTYKYVNESVLSALLKKYLKNGRINQVSQLPTKGQNYYGSW